MLKYICKDTKEICDTYDEYLKSNHWKKVKENMFKSKNPYKCYCCGSKEKLQLHHKTYNRVGCEKLHDLLWLCSSCHNELHSTNPKGFKLWSASRHLRKKKQGH